MYHLVFPLKYRRKVINKQIGNSIKSICKEIEKRYEVKFIEIGYETDHVHFLVQSVPTMSVSKVVRIIKSITGRELYRLHPEIERILWGGKFWTSGYYANTVGQYSNEETIRKYVENQGLERQYKKVYTGQLELFE